ncbi:MAG TPA: hypothetical protein VNE21_01445 [Mycobacteriales bacterium]|nr:hypothetical protein [Mycobacteriales bacterium]
MPDVRRFGLPDPRQLSSAGRWGFGLALAAGLIVLLLVISYLVAAIG